MLVRRHHSLPRLVPPPAASGLDAPPPPKPLAAPRSPPLGLKAACSATLPCTPAVHERMADPGAEPGSPRWRSELGATKGGWAEEGGACWPSSAHPRSTPEQPCRACPNQGFLGCQFVSPVVLVWWAPG